MQKRAQLTIFIIVGIVMVISAAFAIYIVSTKTQIGREVLTKEDIAIQGFITQCLEIVANDALREVGKNGGYVEIPAGVGSQYSETTSYAFLYADKTSFLQTKEQIEQQLANFAVANIDYCLGDFAEFKAQGFEVARKETAVSAKLHEQSVGVEMLLSADFRKDSRTYTTDKFNIELAVPLEQMLTRAQMAITEAGYTERAIQRKIDDERRIRMADYLPLPEFWRGNLRITTYHIPDTTTVLWKIHAADYVFQFATKLTLNY